MVAFIVRGIMPLNGVFSIFQDVFGHLILKQVSHMTLILLFALIPRYVFFDVMCVLGSMELHLCYENHNIVLGSGMFTKDP